MATANRIVTRIQDQDDFSGTPADGDALVYNDATGKWEPTAGGGGGGGGAGSDTTAFHQGGDAFGATAEIGTTDANPVSLVVDGTQVALLDDEFVGVTGELLVEASKATTYVKGIAVYAETTSGTLGGVGIESNMDLLGASGTTSNVVSGVRGQASVGSGSAVDAGIVSGVMGGVSQAGTGTIDHATSVYGSQITKSGAGNMVVASSIYGAEQTEGDANYSGYFEGDVHVEGNLTVTGTSPFATSAALASEASTRASADTTNAGNLTTHAALTTSAHGGIVASNDARLTDSRAPTAHATSHVTGGADVIANAVAGGASGLLTGADKTKLNNTSGTNTGDQTISDATITTTDITTNNASTSKHGFLKKLSNVSTEYMNGQGNWATPAPAVSAAKVITAAATSDFSAEIVLPHFQYSPYIPGVIQPASSPNTEDDDFDDSSVAAKWVWSNQGSATVSETDPVGWITITLPAQSGNNLRTIEQTPPAGVDWTIIAQVSLETRRGTNGGYGGICVRNSSSGVIKALAIDAETAARGAAGWANATTFGSGIGTTFVGAMNCFMKISWTNSTSTLQYFISDDGIGWIRLGTDTQSGMDRVGIFANDKLNVAGATKLRAKFFRRT